MGGSLHAVVYVRRAIGISVRRQVAVCLDVAETEGLDIVALVAYDGATPADAIRCIEVGEADVLLTAHPDVLGPAHVRRRILAEVERLGGSLCFASVMRAGPDPLMELAARMARQGLRAEQIAAVLDIDAPRARDLIRRAGKALCLPLLALCAWAQERAGRLVVGAALAASLVAGETAWHHPETAPTPPEQVEQRPAPAGRTITAPAPPVSTGTPGRRPSTPAVSVPTRLPPPSSASPSPTTVVPDPSPPSLTDCVDLASPLTCVPVPLPST